MRGELLIRSVQIRFIDTGLGDSRLGVVGDLQLRAAAVERRTPAHSSIHLNLQPVGHLLIVDRLGIGVVM